MKKFFLITYLVLIGFECGQGECIKYTIKNPFSAEVEAVWRVSKVSKFNVRISVSVNSLYDLFAKFVSSAGENFEIYRFKKKIAIYDRNTQKWIPYRKNIYLRGIRLLYLRELFSQVLKIVDKNYQGSGIDECSKKPAGAGKRFNFSVAKQDVEGVLSFLFDREELPKESTSHIDINCDCADKLQAINIRFQFIDNDMIIKGIVKFKFSSKWVKKDFNVPEGIKKFLGK